MIGNVFRREKRVPVQISYIYQGKRFIKEPDDYDFDVLEKVENYSISDEFLERIIKAVSHA